MTQQAGFVTLGELLNEHAETDQDEEILERVKILAQEHLPDGWTRWEVTTASKVQVLGDKIDSSVLDKLVYALPTIGLARAFVPEADHLSEEGYRQIRCKLLDWAFTRALILGPPAIANRIRGSAARTELFKGSVEALRPLFHTRCEADRILAGCLPEIRETSRKRSISSASSESQEPLVHRRRMDSSSSSALDDRIGALEQKVEGMFSILLEKLQQRRQTSSECDRENDFSDRDETCSNDFNAPSWKAPDWDLFPGSQDVEEFEWLPTTKTAVPLIPEPSAQVKSEGIKCQRLGTEGWSRIRYKEAEKELRAASVFSPLKINPELRTVASQPSPWMTKQEGILGTITHGLLLQRRALAEGLNTIARKCPSTSAELRQLVADSKLKLISDQLLQYVCGHRTQTMEFRRRAFKTRNKALNSALHTIPPSETHLFDEQRLSSLLRDNGGASSVFVSPAQPTKYKRKIPGRSRSSYNYHSPSQSSALNPSANSNFNQRKRRGGGDKGTRKSRRTY